MTKDIIDRSHDTEARSLAEDIADTVREPLLVLHEDLRVQSANRAFYDAFGAERAEAEGRMVYARSSQVR
jgi:chemotaxis protein methyltransferase CheR